MSLISPPCWPALLAAAELRSRAGLPSSGIHSTQEVPAPHTAPKPVSLQGFTTQKWGLEPNERKKELDILVFLTEERVVIAIVCIPPRSLVSIAWDLCFRSAVAVGPRLSPRPSTALGHSMLRSPQEYLSLCAKPALLWRTSQHLSSALLLLQGQVKNSCSAFSQ